jgi:hypothetical protein
MGEEDELLAAIEVDGEERAAEVLAPRDERPRCGPSNGPAPEHDLARRAAACPLNEGHGCLVPRSGRDQDGQVEARSFESPAEANVAAVHHGDTVAITSFSERACSATALTSSRSVTFRAIAVSSVND